MHQVILKPTAPFSEYDRRFSDLGCHKIKVQTLDYVLPLGSTWLFRFYVSLIPTRNRLKANAFRGGVSFNGESSELICIFYFAR